MCQLCVDAVRRYFPDVPDDDYGDFLMTATAFPCAGGEHVAKQLEEMAEKSGGDWRRAMAIADEEMEAAMLDFYVWDRLHDLGCVADRLINGVNSQK